MSTSKFSRLTITYFTNTPTILQTKNRTLIYLYFENFDGVQSGKRYSLNPVAPSIKTIFYIYKDTYLPRIHGNKHKQKPYNKIRICIIVRKLTRKLFFTLSKISMCIIYICKFIILFHKV